MNCQTRFHASQRYKSWHFHIFSSVHKNRWMSVSRRLHHPGSQFHQKYYTSIKQILSFTSPTKVILVCNSSVSTFPSRTWYLSRWIKAKSILNWSAIWATLQNESNLWYLLVPPAFLETMMHWFKGKWSEMYFAKMGELSKLSHGLLKNPWASDECNSNVMIWSTPATTSIFATTSHKEWMILHFAEMAPLAFFFLDCLL